MRVSSIRLVTVGVALGAGALLSACSGQNTSAPVNVTTASASPKNQAQQQLQAPDKALGHGVQDVNCSANGGGKVGPHQVDLIAVASKAGRVGCTEAFTIVSEYYDNAGKAEGTGRFLTVKGWNCGADTGAEGTGMISCEKDGLSFHTGPTSTGDDAGGSKVDRSNLRFPNTKQTVQLTGYDAELDMVEFHLTRWASGGADNGHFVDQPGAGLGGVV
jgi:hypothetical protein